MFPEVTLDGDTQGPALLHLLLDDEHHPRGPAIAAPVAAQHHVAEGRVLLGKQIGGKVYVVVEVDLNVSGNGLHGFRLSQSYTPKYQWPDASPAPSPPRVTTAIPAIAARRPKPS